MFSRRFVKLLRAFSKEFDIEMELTMHSMSLRVPRAEYPVSFRDRAEGTESKLNIIFDGFKILWIIFDLLRHERPLALYGILSLIFLLLSLLVGFPVVMDFARAHHPQTSVGRARHRVGHPFDEYVDDRKCARWN